VSRASARGLELLAQAGARIRDRQACRCPGCAVRGIGRVFSRRIVDADEKPSPRFYVTVCGPHRGDLVEPRPLSLDGADGPLAWFQRRPSDDSVTALGVSRPAVTPPLMRRANDPALVH
jgi:hypothetical protein